MKQYNYLLIISYINTYTLLYPPKEGLISRKEGHMNVKITLNRDNTNPKRGQ